MIDIHQVAKIAAFTGVQYSNISYIDSEDSSSSYKGVKIYAVSDMNCRQIVVWMVMQDLTSIHNLNISKEDSSDWPYSITYTKP